MLAVIKNEARDNDDVTNEALKAAGSYIGIYLTIVLLPEILIPLGKYLKKLKGSNNTSLTQEEQAFFSSERLGQDQSEALSSRIINGEVLEHNLSSDEADIQENGQNVSSSKKVVTEHKDAGLATNS